MVDERWDGRWDWSWDGRWDGRSWDDEWTTYHLIFCLTTYHLLSIDESDGMGVNDDVMREGEEMRQKGDTKIMRWDIS